MITPVFDVIGSFPGIAGLPARPSCPAPSEEVSSSSTTVSELDLDMTDKQLLRYAIAQSSHRGLKLKRLRETLKASKFDQEILHKNYEARLKTYYAQCEKLNRELEEAILDYRAAADVADAAEERIDELTGEISALMKENSRVRKACARYKRRAAGIRPMLRRSLPDKVTMPACVICLDRERTHVLMPCGHAAYCEQCANVLDEQARIRGRPIECPLCRKVAIKAQKLYF